MSGQRLGVTLYSDAPYYGGAERYLATLARSLGAAAGVRGLRLDLAAIVEESTGADRLAGELAAAGVRVVRASRPGFGWWRQLPALVRLFRQVPGDLLHVNLPSSYDAGVSSVAWAAKRAGYGAVVSTEHLPMTERKFKKFPIKFFFGQWIDRVIGIAEANRPYLVHRHGVDPDRVVSLPNGIEAPPVLSPAAVAALRAEWGAGGRAVIGCVARLTARKGQHTLLAALSRLDPANRPLLVLVGEGEEEAALRARARAFGVETVFTGPRSDAASLPQAFDLMVLASSVETMPLTVLEAMAGSVPVLATNIFGLPEMVVEGRTGRLVPAGDEAALARALTALLSQRDGLVAMGRAARARWEESFTAEAMAARTLDVYAVALTMATGVSLPLAGTGGGTV